MASDSNSLLFNEDFGEWLKQKRQSAGLSQKDVADSLEYSTAQFISNWERGLAGVPLHVLPILAKKYKITDTEMIEKISSVFILNLKSVYRKAKQQ